MSDTDDTEIAYVRGPSMCLLCGGSTDGPVDGPMPDSGHLEGCPSLAKVEGPELVYKYGTAEPER